MDTDTASYKTPLLVHGSISEREITSPAIEVKQPNNNTIGIKFYDPNVILRVSKEVALGYLILLTGGNYGYNNKSTEKENGAAPENELPDTQTTTDKEKQNEGETGDAPQSMNKVPVIDEQTASLAYTAITDGNVLHTCFGLKSAPNGRPTGLIIGEKQSTSIFCCFPSASSSSLQSLRSHKSRKELLKLVEVLREVKDLEPGSPKGVALDIRVIQSYVQCFAAIVKYHDRQLLLGKESNNAPKSSPFCTCLATLSKLLSPKKTDHEASELEKRTLREIEMAFEELKLSIAEEWARLEIQTDVVSVAETGVTVDEYKDDV